MPEKSTSQSKTNKPCLPLPPPITSDVPGTWAFSTMSERVVAIARRTLSENLFSEEINSRIEALIGEIPYERVRLLDQAAPDADDWEAYTRP